MQNRQVIPQLKTRLEEAGRVGLQEPGTCLRYTCYTAAMATSLSSYSSFTPAETTYAHAHTGSYEGDTVPSLNEVLPVAEDSLEASSQSPPPRKQRKVVTET